MTPQERDKRFKTREELANEYQISRRTLYRWLKRACIKLSKGLLTIKEQQIIYDEFGNPKG